MNLWISKKQGLPSGEWTNALKMSMPMVQVVEVRSFPITVNENKINASFF